MKLLLIYYLAFLVNNIFAERIDRIAGGQVAKRDQFPFFAQLHISFNSQRQGFECGGSLIYPQWILTAAHCFPYSTAKINQFARKGWIVVVMGTKNAFGRDGTWNVITEVITHPNLILEYENVHQGRVKRLDNDIALARLEHAYKLNRYIQTIKLPNYDENTTSRCSKGTIVGIGKTSFGNPKNYYVRYAIVHSKAEEEVISDLPEFKRDTVFYTEVEWYKGHALEGDSGGPYVCRNLDVRVQYGVCSAGYNSSTRNRTIVGLYESVDKHLEFIMTTIMMEKRVGLRSKTITNLRINYLQFIYFIYLYQL